MSNKSDQRLALSNEARHPILDIEETPSLQLVIILIAKWLFPDSINDGTRSRQVVSACATAWEQLATHHKEWYRLYTRPAFMAIYFIVVVFNEHDLEDVELCEPFEQSAAEVIVRTFSLFYVIASKWQQDTHVAHITRTKFLFRNEDPLHWYKRWVIDLERYALPVLDYNIAVMPKQWETFIAYLFFVIRDEFGALHKPNLPTLICLQGCSDSSIAGQIPIPERLTIADPEELRQEVANGRKVNVEAIPAFIRALCSDIARVREGT
ncbi:hypothetical protein CC1G_14576 [Coprinopsis cinerea okayama7|uniref:Uncharacterized protein n=1 Tax=Coprinopsis cinerea (strain Okayama-7 / 130 / ATCC MYA-4618 / FGSC 9003) TaxID=240176 RepID=D6RMP8_COPC7|nr:hypothetical protein CC1G_14576 [Coprinopsis cinerea okayama7\|eukprot:XP_002911144.1 hypothetical protein CC1G_14576 [Coprinopsis cinerea okayama7\